MNADGRRLDRRTQEHLRQLAVQRVSDGERPRELINSLGLCRTSICRWRRAYDRDGDAGPDRHESARPTPKITGRRKLQVRRSIVGKDPRQYGFAFGLWTWRIVAE